MRPLSRDEVLEVQRKRTARLVDEDSPVPLEARRRDFAGLEYLPFDEKYQSVLRLPRYDVPCTVKVSLSNGDVVDALRFGFLEFSLDGRVLKLQGYKKRPQGVGFSSRFVMPLLVLRLLVPAVTWTLTWTRRMVLCLISTWLMIRCAGLTMESLSVLTRRRRTG